MINYFKIITYYLQRCSKINRQVMKNFILMLLFTAISASLSGQEIYFFEFFEETSVFEVWTQEYVIEEYDWKLNDGGYSTEPETPGTGDPPFAKEGTYNAYFQFNSKLNEKTKLITPPIDLDYAIKPELRFWHAMDEREFFGMVNEELRIYYKNATGDSWHILETYTETFEGWIERFINLPDTVLTSTFYIAFEGKNSGGAGLCIDSVIVIETGIIPKYLESLEIKQDVTEVVPTESGKNAILRIDFSVQGNEGSIVLDSLVVTSLNTDDNDISTNGVKLYASEDSLFRNSLLIASGQNFSSGQVAFDNIDFLLKRGLTSVWLTYDIKEDLNHEMQGHILDAKILADHIKLNNSYYPAVQKSPIGSRSIVESIFFDDFETIKTWDFTGEFQREEAQGLGGGIGYPDPEIAYSGTTIIGTDLTGLGLNSGNYENSLADRADKAATQLINAKYFRNIKLFFQRWLNIAVLDNAYLDLSKDGGNSWDNLWNNASNVVTDNKWTQYIYNISNYASDQDSLKIRFALGSTDNSGVFSGWNIDDVFLTGDFLTVDAGIVDVLTPITTCGHSSEEPIEVIVKNYAGWPTNDTIPVYFSTDEGVTKYYDTLFVSVPVDGIDTLTLNRKIDLTSPGPYSLIVAAALPSDEVPSNDAYTKSLYAIPIISLPYSQNFESNNGYWRSLGLASWEYGKPTSGSINTAASGEYAWLTKLNANYPDGDSSILESPCFDFTGVSNPVIEFMLKGSTDEGDGMALHYSLNNSLPWIIVPDGMDYYWEWYNESNIYALNTAGWDTVSAEWYKVKRLLPSEIANESSVKFRFLFKSDYDGIVDAGIGIDDIKIYKAPDDVGVTSLHYPISKCELSDTTHVKVYIENYGLNNVISGTKIPVELNLNTEIVYDTLELTGDIPVNDSVLFTFNSTVDMSYAGDYNFIINTNLESNTFFYNDTLSNDTLNKTVSVIGMPNYNPFEDITGTTTPINYILDAGAGYSSYEWQDASSDPTFTATSVGTYKVTVTNADGCSASDTTLLVSSLVNMTMDSVLIELKDSCYRYELTEISVQAVNNSLDGFSTDDSIYFGYQINDNLIVADTLILTDTLTASPPGDTVLFTFAEKCDLRNVGQYNIKIFTNFDEDLDLSDDTLYFNIDTWGGPDVELEFDSIFSSQADTITLDAGAGYGSYLWNVDSTTQTITPTKETRWYVVTVEDSQFCSSDKDSTYIETYDLGINSVVSPVSECEHTSNEVIQVSVHNYSGNTYAIGTKIPFKYYFNSTWENDTVTLGSDFSPGVDKDLTFTKNIDLIVPGEYPLKIKLDSETDVNSANDSIETSIETWGYPEVTLDYDTIYTSRADTVLLIAQTGFTNYMWNDGTENDTLVVTKKYTKKYIVSADDLHGCKSSKDSTQIIAYDLGISELNLPKSSCSHNDAELVKIIIKNYGQDTILSGEKIDAYYKFEDNVPEYEQITLLTDLFPSGTITHQFINTVDLSVVNTYILKTYINYENDVYLLNDTIIEGIRTYSNPAVQAGPDIYTTQPDTVIIIASGGFNNYVWNDGTKNDSLIVTYLASKSYSVTVTDINGCTASDTMDLYTYNITTDSLINPYPYNQCNASDSEPVKIGYINNSQDTLLAGESLSFSYSINSGSLKSGSFILTEPLYPDSVGEFEFTQTANLSVSKGYEFSIISRKTNNDADTDDALIQDVNINAPYVDLGSDTVFFTGSTEIGGTLDTYDSYKWSTGETTRTIIVTTTGTYKVTVTTIDDCEGIGEIYCENTTGVDNIIKGETFKITYYPNPVSENLNIEFANAKNSDIIIEIVNVNGSIVYNRKLENISSSIENIDFSSYANGVYFIRFKIDNKLFVREIIVQ